MDDRNIIGSNRYTTSTHSLFDEIVLGRTEIYDASEQNCWPFCKATDVRDGITLCLGNLCKGYSFALNGHIFRTSEAAYLCGEFSSNTALNEAIQRDLQAEPNAFLAKKLSNAEMQSISGKIGKMSVCNGCFMWFGISA